MQRLIVKNFGPLKDVDLEIRDFMVFIGPQATGKSTLAKLIYFKQAILYNLLEIVNVQLLPSNNSILTVEIILIKFGELFKMMFPYSQFNNYVVKFQYGKYVLSFSENSSSIINCEINGEFLALINYLLEKSKIDRNTLSEYSISSHVERMEFNRVRKAISVENVDTLSSNLDTVFRGLVMPASRSILAYTLTTGQTQNLDYYLRIFSDEFNVFRDEYNTTAAKYSFFQSIVKADYRFEAQNDHIMVDDKSIPLKLASSGQQEILWPLLLISKQMHSSEDTIIQRDFYVIEEPEAHLYPTSQNELMRAFSEWRNRFSHRLVITTHSPYILTSLNNLLYAGILGKDETKAPEIEKVFERKYWINPDQFSAYFVNSGGIESIIDPESGQIDTARIDEISATINEEYGKLLDIELNSETAK